MRLVGLALAAGLGLTASIAAYAVPLEGQTGPAATGPAPGVMRVWGGLASRPRLLEPVARRLGSAALRPEPLPRLGRPLR